MAAGTLPNGARFRYDARMLTCSSRKLLLGIATTLGAFTFATAAVVGCSSSSGGSSSGTPAEAGGSETGVDGGGGTDTSTAADTGSVVVNDCKTFVDRTATGASRTLTWDFPISTAPERCMIVKKNQAVTWAGDFTTHPLTASGGDTPNPIANYDMATGKVTFTKAGNFGFMCGNHPSMTGDIQVIE